MHWLPGVPVTMIRTATPDDLDTVIDLHLRARSSYYRGRVPDAQLDNPAERERWREGWTRAIQRPDTTVLCAERAGAVVGVASFRREDGAAPDQVMLYQLHVDPEQWRGGIGSALHRACLEKWQAAGFAAARLEVYWHNRGARAFYTRHGWLPDQRRRPGPDDTHLSLVLPLDERTPHGAR